MKALGDDRPRTGRDGAGDGLLLRVDELSFAPELLGTDFAAEMWALFEQGELKPDAKLSGIFIKDETNANLDDVVQAIEDAREEAVRRQLGRDQAQAAGGN